MVDKHHGELRKRFNLIITEKNAPFKIIFAFIKNENIRTNLNKCFLVSIDSQNFEFQLFIGKTNQKY